MNFLKTLLLTISFLYASQLSAQFEKGTFQLGADLVTRVEIGDGFPFKYEAVMPEVNYFFFDKLSFGVSGFYDQISRSDSRNSPVFKYQEYNIGLLSRYYVHQKRALSIYLENYLGAGERISRSFVPGGNSFRFMALRVGFGVGLNYQIIPKLAFTVSYRYNRDFLSNDDMSLSQTSFDPRLGLRVNLNMKK